MAEVGSEIPKPKEANITKAHEKTPSKEQELSPIPEAYKRPTTSDSKKLEEKDIALKVSKKLQEITAEPQSSDKFIDVSSIERNERIREEKDALLKHLTPKEIQDSLAEMRKMNGITENTTKEFTSNQLQLLYDLERIVKEQNIPTINERKPKTIGGKLLWGLKESFLGSKYTPYEVPALMNAYKDELKADEVKGLRRWPQKPAEQKKPA